MFSVLLVYCFASDLFHQTGTPHTPLTSQSQGHYYQQQGGLFEDDSSQYIEDATVGVQIFSSDLVFFHLWIKKKKKSEFSNQVSSASS